MISPIELSAHQRKLLLVGGVAIAATLIAVLGLDWFHVRMTLAGGGSAKLDIGLRTVRGCIEQRCETNPVGTESGFGLFATFTFWVGILFAIMLAIQAVSHVVLGRAFHQPMTTIGVMLGVMLLGGLIVCGLLLAPSGSADKAGAIAIDDVGTLVSHRTWAMTLLLLGVLAGFYTLYLAVTDEITPRELPPLVDKPVYVARARSTLAETEGIALEPEAQRERDPFLPGDE